ncbi:MAG: low temperature requirement protein A [Propionibacteriaceae bacterium]
MKQIKAPHHHLTRMLGRDRHESNRAATPLELLYDLTLVIAYSVSGSGAAHLASEGHLVAATYGFIFALFGATWAWINFTWWASAFDTDDWYVRVCTLIQMVGVIVLALGLPSFYEGLREGHFHNAVLVLGYVIMRIGMIPLWIRVAISDPEHRDVARIYAATITIAQIGWCLQAAIHPRFLPAIIPMTLCYLIELGGPVFAERKHGTPWHPHHIAERYGCMTIIALGEVIVGTQSSVQALTAQNGWSLETIVLCLAGIGTAMAMWWTYFNCPWGDLLITRIQAPFLWGYGHLFIFGSIVATGAGFHVSASYLQGETTLASWLVIASSAIPVALFTVTVFTLYQFFMPKKHIHHWFMLGITMTILSSSIVLAALGLPLWQCLLATMLAPWVTVVLYETVGYVSVNDDLTKLTPIPCPSLT